MRMAYGIKVQPDEDPYLNLVEDAMACGRAVTTAGAYSVDMFPIRELSSFVDKALFFVTESVSVKYIPWWFPGAGFQRQAREWRKSVTAMLDKPYEEYLRHAVRSSFVVQGTR